MRRRRGRAGSSLAVLVPVAHVMLRRTCFGHMFHYMQRLSVKTRLPEGQALIIRFTSWFPNTLFPFSRVSLSSRRSPVPQATAPAPDAGGSAVPLSALQTRVSRSRPGFPLCGRYDSLARFPVPCYGSATRLVVRPCSRWPLAPGPCASGRGGGSLLGEMGQSAAGRAVRESAALAVSVNRERTRGRTGRESQAEALTRFVLQTPTGSVRPTACDGDTSERGLSLFLTNCPRGSQQQHFLKQRDFRLGSLHLLLPRTPGSSRSALGRDLPVPTFCPGGSLTARSWLEPPNKPTRGGRSPGSFPEHGVLSRPLRRPESDPHGLHPVSPSLRASHTQGR